MKSNTLFFMRKPPKKPTVKERSEKDIGFLSCGNRLFLLTSNGFYQV